jgi:hypothetical protein
MAVLTLEKSVLDCARLADTTVVAEITNRGNT